MPFLRDSLVGTTLESLSGGISPEASTPRPFGTDSYMLIGTLGNLFSLMLAAVILYLIPKIWESRILGLHTVPYLISLVNCTVWAVYSSFTLNKRFETSVNIFVNAVGAVLYILYLVVFLWFATNAERRRLLLKLFSASVGLLGFLVLIVGVIRSQHETNVLLAVCSTVSIAMYMAPIQPAYLVLRGHHVDCFCFVEAMLALGNGLFWTVYSIINIDLSVLIPNGLGVIVAGVILIFYYWDRRVYGYHPIEQVAAGGGLPSPSLDPPPPPYSAGGGLLAPTLDPALLIDPALPTHPAQHSVSLTNLPLAAPSAIARSPSAQG